MRTPTITVVVCSKNNERTIRSCVESILAQDYPVHQILAVDGLSKDGTVRILEEYGSVKVLSDNGEGLAHARNIGWRNATGEFVAYVDADSEIPSSWLHKMMEEAKRNEQLAGVQDTPVSISLSKNLTSLLDIYFFTVSTYRASRSKDNGAGGIENSLWRRKALQEVSGFDETYKKYFEDLDLITRIQTAGWKTLRAPSITHKHFVRQNARDSFLQYYWRGYFARIYDERAGKRRSIQREVTRFLPSALMHSFLAFKITREVKSLLVFFIVIQKRFAFLYGYFGGANGE